MLFPSVPVLPTAYSDAAFVEEMEKEGTEEETNYQQNSGRGVSAVESMTDRTDGTFSQISAHITVPLMQKHMQQKRPEIILHFKQKQFYLKFANLNDYLTASSAWLISK